MPDHSSIYKNQVEMYDLMISKQPKLGKVIEEIICYEGLDIIELGAGTGRITTELATRAKSIVALDSSKEMLEITESKLKQKNLSNWKTLVADHRALPLENNSADLVISGWSICYLTSSNHVEWHDHLEQIISELKRVLRPGGTILLFETMGTGFSTPTPPSFLLHYFEALEKEFHFSHKWIRTDYSFDHLGQAEELTKFFFGEELASRVVKENLVSLPECAGIWWLKL